MIKIKKETADFILGLFVKRWVCEVLRSGFHNGATCTPGDPHGKPWRCHYRYESSLSAAYFEKVRQTIRND